MDNFEIREEYLKENDLTLDELVEADGDDMMDVWLALNPMPAIDQNDIDKILAKVLWSLRYEEAMWFFIGGEEYPTDISSCLWRIEQEILNRGAGETMAGAAFNYAERLVDDNREQSLAFN